ncbi:MAG: energy-coupling factor ABC transporter permease, partial [Phycisphaerae bacterium]|nr:energy-coupling factor ABC transporter permease [Phycisphaerae bacterium]
MKRNITLIGMFALAAVLLWPAPAQAMHITEGILPASWAGLWFAVAAPFVWWGVRTIKRRSQADPRYKAMVALMGAAIFVVSCMPVPIPGTGSCSHPCGTGLGAIIIGPAATVVVATIALLLQALLLAHGGLSTLGANALSMAIVGAMSGWATFALLRRMKVSTVTAAFFAGLVSDWATYATTAATLALGISGGQAIGTKFLAICIAFAPTQVPLGILEGVIAAGAYRFVVSRRPELLDPT